MRGQNALNKLREYATHSEWNFKNKVLLVEAEFCNTEKSYNKAATLYEASVEAAKLHKFIHEEAIASECAGIFFLERGLRQKSLSYFKHASECFKEQIFPYDKVRLRNNEDILSASLESGQLSWFHSVVYYQTVKSIVFRDMECALNCVNLYYEHILVSDISFGCTKILSFVQIQLALNHLPSIANLYKI